MKEFNSDKAVSCDTPGCHLVNTLRLECQNFCFKRFTDGDVLSAHKKRHDINLTINNRTSGYADQTPTPTRFLRNCEEVGLFQDLQNVNPFEETFRKAVEAVHRGEAQILAKTDNFNDDTLHTPNVFPPFQEVPTRKQFEQPVCEPVIETKPDPPRKIRKYKKKKIEVVNHPTTFVVPENNITFKLPIPRSPSNIKVFSPKYFSVLSKNVKNFRTTPDQQKSTPINSTSTVDAKKTDLMEYNRLAQIRTRQKRKHYLGYLEDANKQLTEKLGSLEKQLSCAVAENAILKSKLDRIEGKSSSGLDASTQTIIKLEKKLSPRFQDHNYIQCNDVADNPELGVIKKPFKKRNLQPKLCISCNKKEC